MSDKTDNQIQPTVTPTTPKLAEGLFKSFTLGSTLEQTSHGNTMSNMKPNMMDYEQQYQHSTKNESLSPETLQKIDGNEINKGKFQEVSAAIQRKQGYSKKRADAIAAAAGRKDLGQAEMTRRAEAGKKEAKKSMDEEIAEISADQLEAVSAELDKRIEKAKESKDDFQCALIAKAKEKLKKFMQSKKAY